ncbi:MULTISPECIES: HEPN domain-containing protein [Acidithiobacillus]|uniref:HEPN domain-containing protein n=2 Tax=Acidithiobacillus thiooxidans TaxID=930 RepID=A0A1C2IYP7_ACITH|nr:MULTISPECIES: HEPN domain-containing protein [Acidithiobacillus]MDA8175712.1 HEPN domain-containing protein [Acidithiobacillus sp.]OCX73985.1 hypothetical protein A6P07_06820 [Acidithiobacillus thiooxidans]OCX81110.1 hypothetical protein A6P08_14530 [Acidithiobacillus thiooxidans]
MGINKQSAESIRWLKQAQHDWYVASLLVENSPSSSCFHSQQSVEKSLKSVLMAITGDTPHTHNIKDLAERMQTNGLSLSREIRSLDMYYTISRYPDANPGEKAPFENYEKLDAQETLLYASQAIEQVRKFMVDHELLKEADLPAWNRDQDRDSHSLQDGAHIADLQSLSNKNKWYSLKLYANDEGDLRASLQMKENNKVLFHQSNLKVKDGKDGGLVVHGDGFGAKIDKNSKVQFFEGKIQVRGACNPSLKAPKGTDVNDSSIKDLRKILDDRIHRVKGPCID